MAAIFQFTGIPAGIEYLLKSSLILAITLFLYLLSRKKSASFRHLLLSTALAALLVLPFVSAFAPHWRLGILPPSWVQSHETGSVPEPGKADPSLDRTAFQWTAVAMESSDYAEAMNTTRSASSSPGENTNPPAPSFLAQILQRIYIDFPVLLWSCGLVFLLARLAFGLYGTYRITGRGKFINAHPWQQLLRQFLEKIPLRRNIRLLKDDRLIVPMTWGVLKPVIIIPGDSAAWPVEQCSTVLLHELAHIKRGDFLVRSIAAVSCALYWFNPLCWIVFRRLKKEQEKACDEMVLKAGIKPSIYAAYLLQVRKSIEKSRGHFVPAHAVGMAGKSELKERLTAILEKKLIPQEEKMKTRITLLILMFAAFVLIGSAKPGKAQLPSYNEETAVSQSSAPVEKAAASDEEKKAEQKKSEKGEKKVEIFISEDEDDETAKEGKKFKKVIIMPRDCAGKDVKVEGDKVIIYEKGKAVKTIELDLKDAKKFAWKDKDGKKAIFIGECADEAHGHNVYKIKTLSRDTEELEKSLQELEKSLQVIDKEFAAKTDAQEKALKQAEKALQQMEEKLKKTEYKHQEIRLALEGAEKELAEIEETDHKHFTVKKISLGEHLCKNNRDTDLFFVINKKIDNKQKDQLKKAVEILENQLPATFKIESEITDDVQKITVKSGKVEGGEAVEKQVQAAIEKFEEELEKIFPGEKDKKTVVKKIVIKDKKEKQEFEKQLKEKQLKEKQLKEVQEKEEKQE